MNGAKKGISLAIETIIFVILAVIVLTVLLFFFTSQAVPAQDRFTLETKRNNICGQYLNYDSTCTKYDEVKNNVGTTALKELGDACARLKMPGCLPNLEATQACIQNCCIACPR